MSEPDFGLCFAHDDDPRTGMYRLTTSVFSEVRYPTEQEARRILAEEGEDVVGEWVTWEEPGAGELIFHYGGFRSDWLKPEPEPDPKAKKKKSPTPSLPRAMVQTSFLEVPEVSGIEQWRKKNKRLGVSDG